MNRTPSKLISFVVVVVLPSGVSAALLALFAWWIGDLR